MVNSKSISVIITTYNGEKYIRNCIESVLRNDYELKEIIIVDNGSTDNTLEQIEEYSDKIKIISTGKNLGFAGGNNIGLEKSAGDILILLNDDTIVPENWLVEAVKAFDWEENIGIVGFKIVGADSGKIEHAGASILPNAFTLHIGYGETDIDIFNRPYVVEYVTGAAMAISREVYGKIGGLEESYFPLYFEEVEYCKSTEKLGLKILYWPYATIRHFGMQTSKPFSWKYFYRYHKNRFRYLIRNLRRNEALKAVQAELLWLISLKNVDQYPSLIFAYFYTVINLFSLLAGRKRLRTKHEILRSLDK